MSYELPDIVLVRCILSADECNMNVCSVQSLLHRDLTHSLLSFQASPVGRKTLIRLEDLEIISHGIFKFILNWYSAPVSQTMC